VNREATKVEAEYGGTLPLHEAVLNKASHEIIMMLYEAHPEAITVQNENYWSPLHEALRVKAFNEIFKMLVNANPEAT
jgi:ankyrin repeat protein